MNGSTSIVPRRVGLGYHYPHPTNSKSTDVRIYAGIMSVVDSDGAISGSIQVSSNNFGLGLETTRYLENALTPMGYQRLYLDVWSLYGTNRVLKLGVNSDTAVWIKLGLAGYSGDDLHVLGATLGTEIAHNLNRNIGLLAGTRVFAMQHDIRGAEASAGVSASLLQFRYRWFKTNVGPALYGPEVGLSLQF